VLHGQAVALPRRDLTLAIPLLSALSLAACRDSGGVFRDSGILVEEDAEVDAGLADSGQPNDSGASDTGPRDVITFDAAPDSGAIDLGVDAGNDEDGGVLDGGGTGTTPGPGDLVFVELQGNPQGTADTDAEYFELLNVSGRMLDLQGCRLTHREWIGATAPVDSVGDHLINTSVTVPIGGRALLTRSNGGYFGGATRDYVYSGFELSNGGSNNNRLRLMAPGWNGAEPPSVSDIVDEVITPVGNFDNDLRGRAWTLDPAQAATAANNDDAAHWCHAASVAGLAYWQQNWGTPRAANACN
jgi:hypothetical protein